VIARDRGANFAKVALVVGVKNHELGEEQWIYKARLVVLGNRIWNYLGKQTLDKKGVYEKPAGLPSTRIISLLGIASPNHVLLDIDIDAAYLTAEHGLAKKQHKNEERISELYLSFPKIITEDDEFRDALGFEETSLRGVRDPVVKMIKSIYGNVDGAADFGAHLRNILETLNFNNQTVRDVDMNAYRNDEKELFSIAYVDDLRMAGLRHEAYEMMERFRGKIKCSKDPQESGRFLGWYQHHYQMEDANKRAWLFEMKAYLQAIVETYVDYSKQEVGTAETPSFKASIKDEWLKEANTGEFAGEVLGMILWAARTVRPDLLFAVTVLTRIQSIGWNVYADRRLHRLMEYINGTLEYGLLLVMDRRDVEEQGLYAEVHTDADLGGCPFTSKSTSGAVCFVRG
jgi:hypothetical protein